MFQQIVLTVAAVILILTLVVIGILLYNQSTTARWPPETASCPDYYTAQSGSKCVSSGTLPPNQNTNCDSHNFSGPGYQGEKGKVRKCQWAKECGGLAWDGISNASPPLC